MNARDTPGLAATSHPGDNDILNIAENTPEGEKWKCPCCGYPLPFQSLQWQNELPILLARYAGELGITPELAGLTLIELYGLYLHLLEYGCKS